jgi:hypothetical protein
MKPTHDTNDRLAHENDLEARAGMTIGAVAKSFRSMLEQRDLTTSRAVGKHLTPVARMIVRIMRLQGFTLETAGKVVGCRVQAALRLCHAHGPAPRACDSRRSPEGPSTYRCVIRCRCWVAWFQHDRETSAGGGARGTLW